MADKLPLRVGVIRDAALFRRVGKSEMADREYRAVRPQILDRGGYKCVFCGWKSRTSNECHHLSGNHADNSPENLKVVDALCHGYQHLGQRASQEQFASDNFGDKSVLAAIPEIPASDVNLLLRAIGVALGNEEEAPIAKAILKVLANRAYPVKEALGTYFPGDFAAAMTNERLTDRQYEEVANQLFGSLRLIFHEKILMKEAEKFKVDYPTLTFENWSAVVQQFK